MEQVTKDIKEYKKQVLKDKDKVDNLGIDIADIANEPDNKSNKICEDSNNHDL